MFGIYFYFLFLVLSLTLYIALFECNGDVEFDDVLNAVPCDLAVCRIYRRMSSSVGLHVPPPVLLLLKVRPSKAPTRHVQD